MRVIKGFFVFLFIQAQVAQALDVVVSIKPLHALMTSLTLGLSTPTLLISPEASPHGYTLKPSEAALLKKAQLVVWVGPSYETFLEKPLHNAHAAQMAVEKISGISLLKLVDDHAGHDHGGVDPHVWLDPVRMQQVVDATTQALVQADPENQDHYEGRARVVKDRLQRAHEVLVKRMKPLQKKGFLVFHEGYNYFVNRYGLKQDAALTVDPDTQPSLKHLKELQALMEAKKPVCVLGEVQFKTPLPRKLAEDFKLNYGELDPFGVQTPAGEDGYFLALDQMAHTFETCLGDVKQ